MSGVPELDDLNGAWIGRESLAHLPSLRNQWGQAHVDNDLSSISWLAMPPYSVGYHTGALRLNGEVVVARDYRWTAWGVERSAAVGALAVSCEVRLGYEETTVFWRHEIVNESAEPVTVVVEQELIAMAARSDVDWGWLYGTPWNAAHQHDFYATERMRAEAASSTPRQVQLLPPDERWLRLGRPRVPGIQRDEDDAPMLMDSLLPSHFSPDAAHPRPDGANARVRDLEFVAADGAVRALGDGEHLIGPATDVRVAPFTLLAGSTLRLALSLPSAQESGVVLTHGTHPDSLQLGLDDGRLWLRIGGEKIVAQDRLATDTWLTIAVTVDDERATLALDGVVAATTAPWWGGQRWSATVDDGAVIVDDAQGPARSAFAFSAVPASLRVDGGRALAGWELRLEPGESFSWGTVLAVGDGGAGAVARDAAGGFIRRFEGIAERWRRTWRAAFTPGNTEFSGHLPTLVTDDADLARTYYLGALLAIYMRNTGVSEIGPVFLTGGPRLGPTTTFYWDQSEWARTAALLEPAGMRAWLLAALGQPYESSHSFDTHRLLPVGNHYASNDYSLFRIVEAYVGVTGDVAVLDEVARGRSVLDHLRAMAYRPRSAHAAFGQGVLVDFGRDAWELLECVPNYRDAVVSFNAAYVGMQRSLATLLERLGGRDEAETARADAARLARAVLDQYAGAGRWKIAHPEGDETIAHRLDFELVSAFMLEDLDEDTRAQMVDFVEHHLLDGDWMRALSPDDPIAPLSDRPDHGAAGAFAAAGGGTSYALFRLGRPDLALGVLRRAHRATSEGLWGQAMEAIGDGRYRVAERGVSNRESTAAVAVTEAVIAGLFAIDAGFAALDRPTGTLGSSVGTLRNVRAIGFDLPAAAQLVEEREA